MRCLCLLFAALALSAHAAPDPRFEIRRFQVDGNSSLSTAEVDATLSSYVGANRDFAQLQAAVQALQAAYAKRGFTLARVTLPEQELNDGVVRLRVVEARIGKVSVEGDRFFDESNIRASVPRLREGETPDLPRISASLALANENPAKKTTLTLLDGRRPGEIDARLLVVDEKPWRVGLNVDNSGNRATGRTLVGLLYQNANLTGRDDVLGLQYTTTAEKPDQVSVYGAGYHIPLYALGDSIDLYASYSDVDSGTVTAGIFDLQLNGKGTMAGARYNHIFARRGEYLSTASAGFDHKAYENSVTFLGFPLGNDITLHPVSLSYAGNWKGAASDSAFSVAAVRNIPGGDNGEQEDFDRVRSGAKAGYLLFRATAAHQQALPAGWQLRAALSGQYTQDSLVPGEQFGAGGMASVRGFESREISNDSGVQGSVEAYTPELCRGFFSCRVLAFYDAAHATRNDALPGEARSASIASVGLGLRAALDRHATLQLDYGHVLDGGTESQRGDHRWNFKLSVSF